MKVGLIPQFVKSEDGAKKAQNALEKEVENATKEQTLWRV
jgi:hypothetical protein